METVKTTLSSHYGSFAKTGEVYDIIFERSLSHAPKAVWEAITAPGKIAEWLGPAQIDLRVNGNIAVQMQDIEVVGRITQLKEEQLLEYTWTSPAFPNLVNALRWELQAEGPDKCKLIFRERLVPVAYLTPTAPGWHSILDALTALLDGKRIPSWSNEDWQEASNEGAVKYEEILKRLKLQNDAAPVVKAEMLIRKPVQDVYEAMIDPSVTANFWYSKGKGRLETGKVSEWIWERYNANVQVSPHRMETGSLVAFTWNNGDISTTVEWVFKPLSDDTTFLSITEQGWSKDMPNLLQTLVGQTEGWTIVLAGLKAYLEHGVRLNLVDDRFP
ncbi:MAG TPA: SRPBCC domain-containing protein [Chitinophaga sp.]|uniref:SRPBCC domain-containing protein n=1 Tax=Chitinophaga sp. TaxID=1869181 RepID=UPI002B51E164|nr:SRPBCC domain-containing protein [Chitinophaga sp.]HVI48631.1 SRPBCC domain-containing protein [Chitinophaga sp.]